MLNYIMSFKFDFAHFFFANHFCIRLKPLANQGVIELYVSTLKLVYSKPFMVVFIHTRKEVYSVNCCKEDNFFTSGTCKRGGGKSPGRRQNPECCYSGCA